VGVVLGCWLAVVVALFVRGVGLGPVVAVTSTTVGDGVGDWVSSRATSGEGVISACSPASTVRAIIVGM
jgi:hypothetical protein